MQITKLLAAMMLVTGVAADAAAPEREFEVPADEAPAASLAVARISGRDFKVRDPVHSDGLMHRYVIESRFGDFEAYGSDELDVRIREIAALTQISETSDSEVALNAVARGIREDVKSIMGVATHPIGTVVGIPRGIVHLLGGYGARARELASNDEKAGEGVAVGDAASRPSRDRTALYVERYMGLSAAERRWYARLGIDPYTRNDVLRSAVRRLARVDSRVAFGMKFAPIGVPYAGQARRVLDVVYERDPRILRQERHKALEGFGLTVQEVRQFEDTLLLNPTRQTALVEAMRSLEGVSGREELLRSAMSVTSEEEVEVFLRSMELLLRGHTGRPVARIVAGVRLPTAQYGDRRVAVFGAFDAVQWTADVAGFESAIRDALPPDASARDVWLSGAVSPRARDALMQHGWEIHDHAGSLIRQIVQR